MISNNSKKLKLTILAALFAAFICVTTAYLFHIPTGINQGYIHIGDAFIYLAACLLPTPYAMAAAAIGAGFADILSGAMVWALPTILIKPLLVLCFTSNSNKIINKRNIIAPIIAGLIGLLGYGIFGGIISGNFLAMFVTLAIDSIQPIGSAIVFLIIGYALDKVNIKNSSNISLQH